MALRIFQFGIVLAVGLLLDPDICVAVLDQDLTVSVVSKIPLNLHVEDPQNVILARGQGAVLRCPSNGTVEKITWLHNDIPIFSNDTRREVRDDGSLFIPKVIQGKKNLTGEYKCLVQSDVGELVTNPAILKIASMELDSNNPDEKIIVNENQPAIIPCLIRSDPPAEIRWDKNQENLPQSSRLIRLPSGALLITKTLPTDAGSYRCAATNNILKKAKDKTIRLIVTETLTGAVTPSILPLNFTTNVSYGQSVKLICAATGWPLPQIQWLNDNKVISNTSILSWDKITFKQSGNYTCVASNYVNTTSLNYIVNVQQKPFFKTIPTSQTFTSGGTVRLDCIAEGVPAPSVYWLKNGTPLVFDGRIKEESNGIILRHTFTSDTGLYQCFASNPAGVIWQAAQVVSSTTTPEIMAPQDVKCRPFDEHSICLTWKTPPNITPIAYVIYPSKTHNSGPNEAIKEQLATTNNYLFDDLSSDTNYSFYVRLYYKTASDFSETVVCQPGIEGKRDLKIKSLGDSSVELEWSKVSTDIACGDSKAYFEVQWRNKETSELNSGERTYNYHFQINDLIPMTEYEFRIIPTRSHNQDDHWVYFKTPAKQKSIFLNDSEPGTTKLTTQSQPTPPRDLKSVAVYATSVELKWNPSDGDISYYMVCYVVVKLEIDCKNGTLVKSTDNRLNITKLDPDTAYEFKVRAHESGGQHGSFSKPIEIQTTPPETPSSVLDLRSKVIDENTVCLSWKAPLRADGVLIDYEVAYSYDQNRPLDQWPTSIVPAHPNSNNCWDHSNETISTLLVELQPNKVYTVYVRAVSDIGGAVVVKHIEVSTTKVDEYHTESRLDESYKQKIGVIAGVVISIICIICCISCILYRKRSITRQRLTGANNCHPAVARYASQGNSSLQVRLEDPCVTELHEIEQMLVSNEPARIPMISPSHLDTKGRDGLSNGRANGSVKPLLSNGHVHITENPQCYPDQKQPNIKKLEDSNSNLPNTNFDHINCLYEKSKNTPNNNSSNKFELNNDSRNSSGSVDTSFNSNSSYPELNSTQMTCLDDSFLINNHRRMSPLLGPNG